MYFMTLPSEINPNTSFSLGFPKVFDVHLTKKQVYQKLLGTPIQLFLETPGQNMSVSLTFDRGLKPILVLIIDPETPP